MSALHRRPVTAHARGRVLGNIALTMSLAAACSPSRSTVADAPPAMMADAHPDAERVCLDPTKLARGYIDNYDTCACGETDVTATFDANGVITAITDLQGNPLPAKLATCLHQLLDRYCYPSLAGMSETFMTCHRWIA
jgi:hypothetical protein